MQSSHESVERGFASIRTACCTHGPPLLETLPAIDGASLGRLKGNCSFLPALRTTGSGFQPVVRISRRVAARILRSFGLAAFASLGLIPKALFGEEHLLSGREDELGTAFGTLQYLIVELHLLLRSPAARGTACRGEGCLRGCPKKTTMREKVPPCPMASEDEFLRTSPSHLSPARAAAFCGDACVTAPLWRGASHRASSSNCAA